jgi:hypothetical protein
MAMALDERQRANVKEFLIWAVPNIWRIQEDAAKALECSQEYVSQLRSPTSGKSVGASVALKIAQVVGVRIEDLLSGRALRALSTSANAVVAQKRHSSRPPPRRTFTPTPTPAPASSIRSGNTVVALTVLPCRERALGLLVERGIERNQADEELALVAFDARLAPDEDRPVAWWLDGVRARLLQSAHKSR